MGAQEFLYNKDRYALWLVDATPQEIQSMPLVYDRVQKVRKTRLNSVDPGARKLAATPSLFREQNNPKQAMIIPEVSSDRRQYIPMDFISNTTIATNLLQCIPNCPLYIFAILNSQIHNAWMRVVAGRFGMGYIYSVFVVYNNFPFPELTETQKQKLNELGQNILDTRAKYPDSTLATLYDPNTMPLPLLKAHQKLDKEVAKIYNKNWDLNNEAQIVSDLMQMYQQLLTTDNKNTETTETEDEEIEDEEIEDEETTEDDETTETTNNKNIETTETTENTELEYMDNMEITDKKQSKKTKTRKSKKQTTEHTETENIETENIENNNTDNKENKQTKVKTKKTKKNDNNETDDKDIETEQSQKKEKQTKTRETKKTKDNETKVKETKENSNTKVKTKKTKKTDNNETETEIYASSPIASKRTIKKIATKATKATIKSTTNKKVAKSKATIKATKTTTSKTKKAITQKTMKIKKVVEEMLKNLDASSE